MSRTSEEKILATEKPIVRMAVMPIKGISLTHSPRDFARQLQPNFNKYLRPAVLASEFRNTACLW